MVSGDDPHFTDFIVITLTPSCFSVYQKTLQQKAAAQQLSTMTTTPLKPDQKPRHVIRQEETPLPAQPLLPLPLPLLQPLIQKRSLPGAPSGTTSAPSAGVASSAGWHWSSTSRRHMATARRRTTRRVTSPRAAVPASPRRPPPTRPRATTTAAEAEEQPPFEVQYPQLQLPPLPPPPPPEEANPFSVRTVGR